jgi:hypothetical protein
MRSGIVRTVVGVTVVAIAAAAITSGLSAALQDGDSGDNNTPPVEPIRYSPEQIAEHYTPGEPWDGRGTGNLTQSQAEVFGEFPVLWLGEEFGGYHLQHVSLLEQIAPPGAPAEQTFREVAFIYGGCILDGGEEPSCNAPLSVQVQPRCSVPQSKVAPGAELARTKIRGDADAIAFWDGSMAIWSGGLVISIHAPGQPDLVRAAADGLRGLGDFQIAPDDPLPTADNNDC